MGEVGVGAVRRLEVHLAEAMGLPLSWYDVLLELEHAPRPSAHAGA
jgi:hypothetical protein